MKKSYNNRCSSLSTLISPPLCYKTWYHPEVIRSFIIWHRNLEILTSQAPMFSMIAPLLILLRIPAITWLPENRAVQKQYYIFFAPRIIQAAALQFRTKNHFIATSGNIMLNNIPFLIRVRNFSRVPCP